MFIQKRRITFTAALLLFVAFFALQGGTVSAHNGEDHTDEATVTSYEYTARPNDNLSIMVRRSIQLYAQANNITVGEPAIMFCEANTVQKLGSKRLAVQEQVSVPFDVIASYLEQSKTLTPAQVSAWQRYADKANFTLAGLEPTNKEVAEHATAPEETDSTENTNSEEPVITSEENPDDSSSFQWYYAVLGIVALGAVYYLLGGRYTPETAKSGKKK